MSSIYVYKVIQPIDDVWRTQAWMQSVGNERSNFRAAHDYFASFDACVKFLIAAHHILRGVLYIFLKGKEALILRKDNWVRGIPLPKNSSGIEEFLKSNQWV